MENFRTNRQLFNYLRENNLDLSDFESLTSCIISFFDIKLSKCASEALRRKIMNFTKTLKSKWISSRYDYNKFITKNKNWLDSEFSYPDEILNSIPTSSRMSSNKSKNFADFSERYKRKTTEEVRNTPEMVDFIVRKQLKSNDALFIYDFIKRHPEHVKKIRQFCEEIEDGTDLIDKETALSTFISAKLTRYQYNIIRDVTKFKFKKLPSYYQIQLTKKDCLPQRETIEISEIGVKVSLQSVLNHTAFRFIKLLRPHLSASTNLTMISKWGCDGASDQSRYKLNFDNLLHDDSSIFICSFVPIKIYSNENNEILWQNNFPSSTRFCRPIEFKFVKEEKTQVKTIVQRIKEEISSLTPSVSEEGISIKHTLLFTMIDNKICNIMTNTQSSMKCYLCGASPKEMNDLSSVKAKIVKDEYFSFGLSSLHCWIRCFECLLHISYRINIKCWAVRNENHKREIEQRKREIQMAFRTRTGLLIDVVKQGKGTSNDGNTARKFFSNPELSAAITGLDENLITRFGVLLQTIASGKKINVSEFESYSLKTAELYISLYPWYYMPVSVHKLLIHGSDIIKNAIVPIGQLSEDAQEANHKYFRKYRENHSRKMSRIQNNEDIFNNLMIASDPIISNSRKLIEHKKKELSEDAQRLLYFSDDNNNDD